MLKKLLLIFTIFCGVSGAVFADDISTNEQIGGMQDVGSYGVWATPNNRINVVNNLTNDLTAFQPKPIVKNFVPIEAKIGHIFIRAMNHINNVLERSLVKFIVILLVTLYAFWMFFEAYSMMFGKADTGDAKKLVQDVITKGIIIGIWIFVLEFGPGKIFMYVMGPILKFGSFFVDFILNATTQTANVSLPDTCSAINGYVMANPGNVGILDPQQTSSLLCISTRLSGFFYTAIVAGFRWMVSGLGHSMFTFTAGLVFVALFVYNAYKFAIMTLGIVADLFFAVMFLPFTAVSECFGKGTSYEGIAGQFFKQFAGMFKTQSLDEQIMKFINAILYFISLSIIIGICMALLSSFITIDLASKVPTVSSDEFIPVLIVGCLVAYLATKAGEFAKQIGGKVAQEKDSFGQQLVNDVKGVLKNIKKTATDIWIKAKK